MIWPLGFIGFDFHVYLSIDVIIHFWNRFTENRLKGTE